MKLDHRVVTLAESEVKFIHQEMRRVFNDRFRPSGRERTCAMRILRKLERAYSPVQVVERLGIRNV